MNIPKIISAQVIQEGCIYVQFSDGSKIKYPISTIVKKHSSFTPLQELAFLRNFTIEAGGYALSWNEDIDISEYELWKNGEPV